MMHRRGLLLAIGCILSACEEAPTSARLEQSVFNLVGGLGVGESIVLSGSDAERVMVGGLPKAGEFLYVPFHASETNGTLQLELAGEGIYTGEVSDALQPTPGIPLLDQRRPATLSMHERMHARMTREASRFFANPVRRSSLSANRSSVRTSLGGGNAQVGQLVDLNADATGAFCQGIDLRRGRVEAIGQRAIVVGDINNPAGGFTRADYESFADQFDDLVDPTVREYFSDPTDIDENGKVIVFFTAAVNELTEDATDGYISGFFWARDLVPVDVGCPASNEGEIFYLLVPDPNRQASPISHTRDDVLFDAVAVIGHEYQHLINAGRRLYVNDASDLEETWLDEGLSHMAEEMLFYAASDRQPRSNISYSSLILNDPIEVAINQFMVPNLVRYGLYLEEVTQQSATSGEDDLESRGAAWSFLRYVADHSSVSDQEFLRMLVNGPQTGFANLRSAVEVEPLELLRRWGVSIHTDDFLNGVDSMYTQPSWNHRSLLPLLFSGFPLDVETLGASSLNLSLQSGTSGYVTVRGQEGQVSRVTTTSGGAAPGEQLQVTVIRTF